MIIINLLAKIFTKKWSSVAQLFIGGRVGTRTRGSSGRSAHVHTWEPPSSLTVKRKDPQHENERGPSGVLLYLIINMSSVCSVHVTQRTSSLLEDGGMWTLTISSCTPETVPGKKRQTETLTPFYQLAGVSSKPKSWLLLLLLLLQNRETKSKLLRITNNPTRLLKRSPSPPRASEDDDDDDHTSCDSRSLEISWITSDFK